MEPTEEKKAAPDQAPHKIIIDKKDFAQKDAVIRVEKQESKSSSQKQLELKKILSELPQFDEECVAGDKQHFPDDRLIDVNDKFYSNPERVIQKMHDSVWGNLNRPISQEGRQLLKEIVHEDPSLNPDEVYNQINNLEICRPARTMTYLETVYEAYAHRKWNDKVRQELVFVTYSMFEFVIKKEYSTPNLLLMLNLMRSMAENGVIGKEALDEVNRMFTRVVDQEKYLRDGLRDGKNKTDKLNMIKEDLQIKDDVGEEIMTFIRDYRRRFAPDFSE